MIQPDDDFDDDFEDGDAIAEAEPVTMSAAPVKPDRKQHDTRRRIEEILEAKRLREEFGELDY